MHLVAYGFDRGGYLVDARAAVRPVPGLLDLVGEEGGRS